MLRNKGHSLPLEQALGMLAKLKEGHTRNNALETIKEIAAFSDSIVQNIEETVNDVLSEIVYTSKYIEHEIEQLEELNAMIMGLQAYATEVSVKLMVEAEKVLAEFLERIKAADESEAKAIAENPLLESLQNPKSNTILTIQAAYEKFKEKLENLQKQITPQASQAAIKIEPQIMQLRKTLHAELGIIETVMKRKYEEISAYYKGLEDAITEMGEHLVFASLSQANIERSPSEEKVECEDDERDIDLVIDITVEVTDTNEVIPVPCGNSELQKFVDQLVDVAVNVQFATTSAHKKQELENIINALLEERAISAPMTELMLQDAFKNMLSVVLPHRKLNGWHVPLASATDSGDSLLAQLKMHKDLIGLLGVRINNQENGLSYQDLRVHLTGDAKVTSLFFRQQQKIPHIEHPLEYRQSYRL